MRKNEEKKETMKKGGVGRLTTVPKVRIEKKREKNPRN